ncbi:MAG: S-layer homology domain-containing protein [Clostridiales bacterium]|nr:S-layer homology domain-containing protein [Clostridiales bacterium]
MKRKILLCLCLQLGLTCLAAGGCEITAYAKDSNSSAEESVYAEKAYLEESYLNEEETSGSGLIIFNTSEHIPYAKTDEYNCFRPREAASRGEIAAMLYELLADKSTDGKAFDDVSEESEYYAAVGAVCSAGLMSGRDDGLFHAEEVITRGEFAAVICNIFGLEKRESSFADIYEGYWAEGYIGAACEAGYLSGYENGLFMPLKAVTRAEAVSAVNRILGRKAGENVTELEDITVMPDVLKNDWAYGDILEATVPHTCETENGNEIWKTYEPVKLDLDYGFINVGDFLFYVNGDTKQYVTDTVLGNFTFDENGRYTTGNEELDGYLSSIISKITNSDMTKEEKLYACYEYMRDNFKYQKGSIYSNGSSGWDVDEALKIFSKGKGNCYSFASGFTHLAREIGYDAVPIAGQVPSARSGLTAHGWTEIVIDGVTYVFDPELAMANGYDLFKKTYSQTAIAYYK